MKYHFRRFSIGFEQVLRHDVEAVVRYDSPTHRQSGFDCSAAFHYHPSLGCMAGVIAAVHVRFVQF